ncbi:MAG: biopolymer transporter ExbD [Opitutales bacterium]
MARTFRRKKSLDAMNELNMTPLMDLAFSLLIIFMVATPLLEQSIELDLPKQEQNINSKKSETGNFRYISIDKNSNIYLETQKISLEELDVVLRGLSLEASPPSISLRCDGSLNFQKIIDVINLIKKNNLTKLHVDTQVR